MTHSISSWHFSGQDMFRGGSKSIQFVWNPVYPYSMAIITNYHKSSALNNMNLFSHSSVGQNTDTTMLWICPSEEWQDFLNLSYHNSTMGYSNGSFLQRFSDEMNVLKGQGWLTSENTGFTAALGSRLRTHVSTMAMNPIKPLCQHHSAQDPGLE